MTSRKEFIGLSDIPSSGSFQQIKADLVESYYLPNFDFVDPETGDIRWLDPRKYSRTHLSRIDLKRLRRISKIRR